MQHSINAAASQSSRGGDTAESSDIKKGKKRGSYNCGRCGLPKKGHNCNIKTPISTTTTTTTPVDSSLSIVSVPSAVSVIRQPPSNLRRALSFDGLDDRGSGLDLLRLDDKAYGDGDGDGDGDLLDLEPDLELDLDMDFDSSGLPGNLRWEVLRRLPPAGLLSAAKVCKGWRETARKLWKATEELKLRVPVKVHVGFVASMLQKCPGILRLSLRMERCEIFQIHVKNKIN